MIELKWWIIAGLLLGAIVQFIVNKRLKQELRNEKIETAKTVERLSTTRQRLSEVKARRKKLLAASTQALIIVESDGKISSANKVARRLFGKPEKDATLISWTYQHQLQEQVIQTLIGEKMPPLYFNYGELSLEAHARAIREQKDVVAVALAIHDVTELERLSRTRRDFVANISHELRTPLASIQLLTDTLLNGGLDEPVLAFDLTTKIANQVDTLNQLAQEVLDLSMIESGKILLKMSTHALHPIVQTQIESYDPQAQRKRLTINNNVDEELLVLVDNTIIARVVSNLVHNAIKFTEQGGSITVTAQKLEGDALEEHKDDVTGAWVQVSVSDTGVGLSVDELDRIFERFYKVDRARNRKESGTGLGLAIARHIVESHRGDIWAEQNRGDTGATFHFTVPTE